MRAPTLVVFALFFLATCAPRLPFGSACERDDDCADGLTCHPVPDYDPESGQCADGPSTCTRACETDDDCAELDSGARCFSGCEEGDRTCGLTV